MEPARKKQKTNTGGAIRMDNFAEEYELLWTHRPSTIMTITNHFIPQASRCQLSDTHTFTDVVPCFEGFRRRHFDFFADDLSMFNRDYNVYLRRRQEEVDWRRQRQHAAIVPVATAVVPVATANWSCWNQILNEGKWKCPTCTTTNPNEETGVTVTVCKACGAEKEGATSTTATGAN